jgi:hypothetical protein
LQGDLKQRIESEASILKNPDPPPLEQSRAARTGPVQGGFAQQTGTLRFRKIVALSASKPASEEQALNSSKN